MKSAKENQSDQKQKTSRLRNNDVIMLCMTLKECPLMTIRIQEDKEIREGFLDHKHLKIFRDNRQLLDDLWNDYSDLQWAYDNKYKEPIARVEQLKRKTNLSAEEKEELSSKMKTLDDAYEKVTDFLNKEFEGEIKFKKINLNDFGAAVQIKFPPSANANAYLKNFYEYFVEY